jgi:type I restriction enzyme M protein
LAAIRARDNVLQNYLFHFLDNNQTLFTGHIGMSFDSISTSEELPEIKIPLPPLEVQQQIVHECEAVDGETDQARQTITAAKQKIEELVSSVEKTSTLNQVVDRISDIVNPKEENGSVYYVGLENIESQTGALSGDPQSDFSEIESNKNAFRKGDLLYGKLRPNLNKVHLVQVDGICSTDILVLRPYTPSLATFYKHYFLSEEFNSEVVKTVSGQQLPRTSWEKINRIPVPLIDIPKQLVAEVEQLDAKIPQVQAVIDNATERKNTILTNYLK